MLQNAQLLPFVGPPFGLPLWELLVQLPYQRAAIVWCFVLGAAFVQLVYACVRLSGERKSWLNVLAVVVFSAAFGPVTAGFALGQVAAPCTAAVAGVTLAIADVTSRQRSLAVFCQTLVAALQPNIAIVLAVHLRNRRALVPLGTAAIAAIALSLALWPLPGVAHYASTLAAHAGAEEFAVIQFAPSAIFRAFGVPSDAAKYAGIAVALAALALVVAQQLRMRYEPAVATALAAAALPFVLPFSHEADLAPALLAAVICLRRSTGGLWLVAFAGAFLVAVNWLDLAQHTTPLATSAALLACALLGALVLGRRVLTQNTRTALGAAALVLVGAGFFALCVLISQTHVVPVWPDALPSIFTAPRGASGETVWHLELLRSGLIGANPWSGFLRALSLLGCALLWYASSLLSKRSEGSLESAA